MQPDIALFKTHDVWIIALHMPLLFPALIQSAPLDWKGTRPTFGALPYTTNTRNVACFVVQITLEDEGSAYRAHISCLSWKNSKHAEAMWQVLDFVRTGTRFAPFMQSLHPLLR